MNAYCKYLSPVTLFPEFLSNSNLKNKKTKVMKLYISTVIMQKNTISGIS